MSVCLPFHQTETEDINWMWASLVPLACHGSTHHPSPGKNGTGRMGLADMDCKETAFKTDAEHGNRSPQEVGKSKASFLNIGNVPKLGILLKFLIYSVCVNKRHRYRRTHRTQDKRDSVVWGETSKLSSKLRLANGETMAATIFSLSTVNVFSGFMAAGAAFI